MKKSDRTLTASMEDYLEMICRLSAENGFTRINELSRALNVQSPSATKMVQRLSELKLLKYEKYGVLILEDEGKKLGSELISRHNIVEDFIKIIGVEEADALIETEKIEHTVSGKTTKSMEDFLGFVKENPDILTRYAKYRSVLK
jgi:Mn-dependent DtxR family transcriptional regulator